MKKRGFVKRGLAFLLTITMTIGQMYFTPSGVSAAANPEDLEVVSARTTDKDVILSTTVHAPVTTEDLQEYLDFTNTTGKVNVNTTNINTTDLSSWYVYDHYDTALYANEAIWESDTGYNKALRPYYAYAEYQTGNRPPTTIANLMDSANWGRVVALNQHIYTYQEAGRANMVFYGYGGVRSSGYNGFTDFLYYPYGSEGTKNVSFKVYANEVRTHSLVSAGFLVNCEITGANQNAVINGYAIVFEYSGTNTNTTAYASGIRKVSLLRLTNVNVNQLHNSGNYGFLASPQTSVTHGIRQMNGVAVVEEKALDDLVFKDLYDVRDINLKVTKNHIKASMKAQDEEPIQLFDTDIEESELGGFGPYVGYNSHYCDNTSSYKFTDLKMSVTNTASVLDPYANADYTQKANTEEDVAESHKYFVVIGDNTKDSDDFYDLSQDDVFLEMLKKEKVVLITNLDIKNTSANKTNYNLTEYLGAGNVHQIQSGTAESMAAQIESIVNGNSFLSSNASTAKNSFSTTGKATPGANGYVTYRGYQVGTVNRNRIPIGGIPLQIESDGLAVNAKNTVTYTVMKPDGNIMDLGDSASFTIVKDTGEWPTGTYTVTMSYDEGIRGVTYFNLMSAYDVSLNGTHLHTGNGTEHVSLTEGTVGKGVANENEAYKTTLYADSGYTLPSAIRVVVHGTDLIPNTDYSYNSSTGAIEIASNQVTGNVDIFADTYNVKKTYTNVTESNNGKGGDTTSSIEGDYTTTFSNNSPPTQIAVRIGDTVYILTNNVSTDTPSGGTITYNSSIRRLTITSKAINGDIEIIATRGGSYPVNYELEHLGYSGTPTATGAANYTTTLSTEEGYLLPSQIEVKVGGLTLTQDMEYTYNDGTGEVTIPGAFVNGAITITAAAVRKTYSVTKDIQDIESFSGADTVSYGTEYTGRFTRKTGYRLPDTITVEVDGVPLSVGTDYAYDAYTGEFKLKGERITGNVFIVAVGIGIREYYDVTIVGDNVTAEEGTTGQGKARYGEDYWTKVKANKGYQLPSTIVVRVGDKVLIDGEDYTYHEATGEVTIMRTNLDDDIVIEVDAIPRTYTVSKSLDKLDFNGEDAATHGADYTGAFTCEDGYDLPVSISVVMDDEGNGDFGTGTTLKAGLDYSYDPNTGVLTILGDKITGNLLIVAAGTQGVQTKYDVKIVGGRVVGLEGTVGEKKAANGEEYQTTLITEKGYRLPSDIDVTIGNVSVTRGNEYAYNKLTGEVTVFGRYIEGNIVITVNVEPNVYDVVKDLENVDFGGGDTTIHGEDYMGSFVAKDGYLLPASITVIVDEEGNGDYSSGKELVEGTDYRYRSTSGTFVLFHESVVGNVLIVAKGVIRTYNVTIMGDNVASVEGNVGNGMATYHQEYKTTLKAKKGYELTDNVKVTVGGKELNRWNMDYDYDCNYPRTTGKLTIHGAQVEGDVTIEVGAIPKTYSVDVRATNVTYNETTSTNGNITHQTDYTGRFTSLDGYTLPTSISVVMSDGEIGDIGSGTMLKEGVDYTYDPTNGELTIYGDAVTGNLLIVATGIPVQGGQNKYNVTIIGENVTYMDDAAGEDKAISGKEYRTNFKVQKGYRLPNNIEVTIGDRTATKGDDYVYNKTTGDVVIFGDGINGHIIITVKAIQAGATITIDTDSWDNETDPSDAATYYNDTKVVEITATHDTDDIYYHITDVPVEDPTQIPDGDWDEYDDAYQPVLDEEGEYVIYAKVTDGLGNETIVHTGTIVIDKTPPVISNIEDGGTYYGNTEFTVTDAYVSKVTLDGIDIELDNGSYVIPADNRPHVITAIDEAGNETILTITVYETFTILYLPGTNGTGESTKDDKKYNDEAFRLRGSLFTRTGYTQIGWAIEDNGTKVYDLRGEYAPNMDVVLYPVWKESGGDPNPEAYAVTILGDNVMAQAGTTGLGKATRHHAYKTRLTTKSGFILPDDVVVTVGLSTLEKGEYDYNKETGEVTIHASLVEGDITIQVEAVAMGPHVIIRVDSHTWDEPTTDLDDAIYFNKPKEVEIIGLHVISDVDGICYLVSNEPIGDVSENTDDEDWMEYEPENKPVLEEDGEYVIYAKVVDDLGNETVIHSGRIIIDQTPPVITGIEDGGVHYGDLVFSVTDDHLDKVTVDGREVELENGKYAIPADNQAHAIKSTDKAGNETIRTVTVYEVYTVTYLPGANGMGESAKDEKKYNDHSFRLRGVIFTRNGYTQIGWATGENGAISYDLMGEYTLNQSITLYPVWQLKDGNPITENPNPGTPNNTDPDAGNPNNGNPAPNVTEKLSQDAPPPSLFHITDTTYRDSTDGAISGVTQVMEYSRDGGKTWIPGNGNPIGNLPAGAYLVRYRETDTHYASPATTVNVESKSQELDIPTIYMTKIMGRKQKFQLTMTNVKGATIRFYSSNTKVATVNKKGLVKTNNRLGKTLIIISVEKGKHKLQYVMPLQVKKGIKKNYSLAKFKTSYKNPSIALYKLLNKGKKWKIKITHTNKSTKINYQSDKKSVATVDKNGRVNPKKNGKATITVTVKQNGVTNKYYVVVRVIDGKTKSDTSYLRVVK